MSRAAVQEGFPDGRQPMWVRISQVKVNGVCVPACAEVQILGCKGCAAAAAAKSLQSCLTL